MTIIGESDHEEAVQISPTFDEFSSIFEIEWESGEEFSEFRKSVLNMKYEHDVLRNLWLNCTNGHYYRNYISHLLKSTFHIGYQPM